MTVAHRRTQLPEKLSQRVLNMEQLRSSLYGPHKEQAGLDIKFILDHTRDTNAERPHDKVYSVLGMLRTDSAAWSIQVNYDKDLMRLNCEVSCAVLAESVDGLNLLFSGGMRGPGSSWAMDFTNTQWEFEQGPPSPAVDDMTFALRCEPGLRKYHLNAGGRQQRRMRQDRGALILDGLHFDEVAFIGGCKSRGGEPYVWPEPTWWQRRYSS